MERVELRTGDGMRLVANFEGNGSRKGVLLLHQFRLDKSTYAEFAEELTAVGLGSLALDFRGHGESDGRWESLGEAEFRSMLRDAEAGSAYLKSRGYHLAGVIGASIGANTALRFSSINHVPAILLSPGLVYHGIDINDVTSTSPTLLVVAAGDTYSADSCKELDQNNLLGQHQLVIVPGKEHGTFLLPVAKAAIKDFLDQHIL